MKVAAIVDPETWELAQEQLRKNRERATRNNTKHHYLLRSLLVCGVCGKSGSRYHSGQRVEKRDE